MKVKLNIEDWIVDKMLEIADDEFESYKFLNKVEQFSNRFISTLNEGQKKDFQNLLSLINDYETSKECEIIKTTIEIYKSLLK